MSGRTVMKEKPEIVFPVDTWHVTTGEIPRLIAEALHPKPQENEPITIIALRKIAKPEASEETLRWSGWPVDDDDWKILNEIWADLPPLNLPVTEEAWQPYIKAFRERSSLGWDLDWVLNKPLCTAENLRHTAINEQTKYLRNAINSGDLEQLHPDSHIPTTTYLESGIVTVKTLTTYVAKFSIEIRLVTGETAPMLSDSGQLIPTTEQGGGEFTADANIAALFDTVTPAALEKMFPSEGKWKAWHKKAKEKGLDVAREKRGKYNPYCAALWWLDKQAPRGWDLARCCRVLATNLPTRSRGNESLLTGELE